MSRGKAVLVLGVLAGAAALGLGGSMAAKRQPLPLPARYDLRDVYKRQIKGYRNSPQM